MKLTREQLKSLIKECIVEVLSEGIGTQPTQASGQSRGLLKPGQAASAPGRKKPPFDARLDTPVGKQTNPQLEHAIRSSAHGNSAMEAIFADTAATTLQAQGMSSDSRGAGSTQSQGQTEQINGTPEQVFGEEVSAKWASLAFADLPAKKTA